MQQLGAFDPAKLGVYRVRVLFSCICLFFSIFAEFFFGKEFSFPCSVLDDFATRLMMTFDPRNLRFDRDLSTCN